MPTGNTSRPRPAAAVRRAADFDGAHQDEAARGRCSSRCSARGGRNDDGRMTVAPPRRRSQAPLPRRSTSGATRTACRRGSRRSSTIRTARRASRCCTTPTARSATSSRRSACSVGDTVVAGAGRRHQAGQRAAAERHPARHDRAQRRAAAGHAAASWAAAPARRRSSWPRRASTPCSSCRRASCAWCGSRCRATIGQVGNVDHENVSLGKAGRTRWLGPPAARARRGDEPGRPSARRRRGHARRAITRSRRGAADQGLQDAPQQAHRPLHRQAARKKK